MASTYTCSSHSSCLLPSVCYLPWLCLGFPGGSDGKESACSEWDPSLVPGSGRPPGGGHGYPLQYSCLGNPMDRRAWWATVPGVTKSWARLSDKHFHFLTALGLGAKDGLSQHNGLWKPLILGWMPSHHPCFYAPPWAHSPHSTSLSPLLKPKLTPGWCDCHLTQQRHHKDSQQVSYLCFGRSPGLVCISLPGPCGRQSDDPQSPHPHSQNLWTWNLFPCVTQKTAYVIREMNPEMWRVTWIPWGGHL